jgi:manganese/zinc/iron transport system permease protein
MNPYACTGFLTFFKILFFRLVSGQVFNALAYDEMQLITLVLVGLSCALVGAFATLRKKAMLANALSHTALVGIILAFLVVGGRGEISIPILLIAALISAFLTSGIVWILERRFAMSSDGAIGLAFTALFSIGILLATAITRRTHIGLETVMGSADVLQVTDLYFACLLFLSSILFITLFYSRLRIFCFDAKFAKVLGMRISFVEVPLLIILAFVVMGGFRCVGALMVLSYLVIPPAFARLFSKSLKGFLTRAALVSTLSVILGVAFSRAILTYFALPLSTGALSATLLSITYVLGILYARKKRVAISSTL